MVKKVESFTVDIVGKKGFFGSFSGKKEDCNFEGLSMLRRVLSNEKARLLSTVKNKNPKSLYELAKILERDFKSVVDDVKLLENFGLIDMIQEKTGKRIRLKPIIAAHSLNVKINI